MNAQSAARIATIGFLALAIFQLLLVLGFPLASAAFGGQYEVLPTSLRVGSLISIGVYLLGIYTLRSRAGLTGTSSDSGFARFGAWFFAASLLFGALLNAASSSPWERFLWAPFALIMSAMSLVVARRKQS